MRQHNTQFIFWNNAVSKFRKLGKQVLIQSLSHHSMRNFLGTGGSKDPFFWNNSFATQLTNKNSSSQRQGNIWPPIRRSKSLNPLLPPGVRMGISASGSTRVTPGFIHTCNPQRTAWLSSRTSTLTQSQGKPESIQDCQPTESQAKRPFDKRPIKYSNKWRASFCLRNQVIGHF